MSEEAAIVEAVRAAVGERPIVLAGSRATGRARDDSDWDVVVVAPARAVPFLVRRLARLSRRLSAQVGAPVSVNPLPEPLLRDQRRLFVWKLRREGRVLYAPHGWSLPTAGPPKLTDEARFSFAVSGLLYLDAGRREHARLVLAQLEALAHGAYVDEAPAEVPRDAAELRRRLVDRARPFPRAGARTALMRNLQYIALSALRGRVRVGAVFLGEPIDHALARRLIDGADVSAEWPAAHPLMGL